MHVWVWVKTHKALFLSEATRGWIGSILILGGLVFTGVQINKAQEALRATTEYNITKDYTSLYELTTDPDFVTCFSPPNSKSQFSQFPTTCSSNIARDDLFKILAYFELLRDMVHDDAVTKNFYHEQVKSACYFLGSPNGQRTLQEFKSQGELTPKLVDDLEIICSMQL